MNMGRVRDQQIVSGVSASNSLAVLRRDAGFAPGSQVGGVINKAGVSFEPSFARSEDVHQAVRTLIDLSTVELFGKVARVPNWECMGIDTSHSLAAEQRRAWQSARNKIEDARQARSLAPPRAAAASESPAPQPRGRARSLASAVEQQIGQELAEADRGAIDLQLRRLLEAEGASGQRAWSAETGNSGVFNLVGASAQGGRACKAVDRLQQIGPQQHAGHLVLCASADGGWDVVESRVRRLAVESSPAPAPAPAASPPAPTIPVLPPGRALDDSSRFPTRRP